MTLRKMRGRTAAVADWRRQALARSLRVTSGGSTGWQPTAARRSSTARSGRAGRRLGERDEGERTIIASGAGEGATRRGSDHRCKASAREKKAKSACTPRPLRRADQRRFSISRMRRALSASRRKVKALIKVSATTKRAAEESQAEGAAVRPAMTWRAKRAMGESH